MTPLVLVAVGVALLGVGLAFWLGWDDGPDIAPPGPPLPPPGPLHPDRSGIPPWGGLPGDMAQDDATAAPHAESKPVRIVSFIDPLPPSFWP